MCICLIFTKLYFKSLNKKVNTNSSVLFENRVGNKNEFFGRDEYLNSVIVKSNEELIGKIKTVNILSGNQNTLNGKIIKKINTTNFAA